MSTKTDCEVIIGGKVYTLSGYESEEYLTKVATYLSTKIAELRKEDGYKRLSLDLQNILLEINIADDYFKAKSRIDLLEEEIENKEKELYDSRRNFIAEQMKRENSDKALKALQYENNENAKKLVRMETELKNAKGIQDEEDATSTKSVGSRSRSAGKTL